MKYAVIKINGKQYKVTEGQEILVDKISGKEIDSCVLLVVNDTEVLVGDPIVKKADIKLKIISDMEKGKKVTVSTYKAKSRHRRKIGFRPFYTRLLVEKI